MKIEPRKIKKTLKYAAVGACVTATLVSTGCDLFDDVATSGALPAVGGETKEETQLAGIIVSTPGATIQPLPDKGDPEKDDLILSGDIAFPEKTPEIAGGIPVPDLDELDPSGEPPQ